MDIKEEIKKYKLMIATPFYEVKAYSPYITSLLEMAKALNELKIDFDYMQISGDSYVDRAKNSLIHRFLKTDCTHILMIDSDLDWDTQGFIHLLKASLSGAEVVGGTYPNKNAWETFGVIPEMTPEGNFIGHELNGVRLLEMKGIPGGFLIYSRQAFERTMPNVAKAINYGTQGKDEMYEFFKCSVERDDWQPKTKEEYDAMSREQLVAEIAAASRPGTGTKIGEDIYFQQRYREMGGQVWLEPFISFGHYGVKRYFGNFGRRHLVPDNLKIHVLVPFTRKHLRDEVLQSFKGAVLHTIMEQKDWIDWPEDVDAVLYGRTGREVDSCYSKINYFIETQKINDEDYYCMMGDDDSIEDNVFEEIRKEHADVVFVSMKRGHYTPTDVPEVNQHPTNTLWARPEYIKVGTVGLEQMFIKGRVLKRLKMNDQTPYGDGELAVHLKQNYQVTYREGLFVLFNYFQPGRWYR
jgi:hypothetical protein